MPKAAKPLRRQQLKPRRSFSRIGNCRSLIAAILLSVLGCRTRLADVNTSPDDQFPGQVLDFTLPNRDLAGRIGPVWPQAGYDSSRQRQSAYYGPMHSDRQPIFRIDPHNKQPCYLPQIVVGADGTLYVTGNDNRIFALNPRTRVVLWEARLAGPICASPAIGPDGTVYVQLYNRLFAFDGGSGAMRWAAPISEGIGASNTGATPAIGADGTIYVGSGDRSLYALKSQNGDRLWRVPLGAGDAALSPSIGSGGIIFSGIYLQSTVAVDAGGTIVWRKENQPIVIMPGHDNILYIQDKLGSGHALDQASGIVRWTAPDKPWRPIGVGADGMVYAVSGPKGKLEAREPGSWAARWSVSYALGSNAAIGADQTIYSGNGPFLGALDGRTGMERWRVVSNGLDADGPPAIGADGLLFVGAADGTIYSVGP